MEAKNTGLPWRRGEWRGEVEAKNGELLATVYPMKEGGDLAMCANADFIVRAVNSHAALVVALKEALATIDDYLNYEHNGDPWTEDARAMGEMDIDDYSRDGRLDRARAALASAEAK